VKCLHEGDKTVSGGKGQRGGREHARTHREWPHVVIGRIAICEVRVGCGMEL
jgi:hypothetical protein